MQDTHAECANGLAVRLEYDEEVKISEISREAYFPGNDYDTDIIIL